MKFEESFQTLPTFFYETVPPTPLKEAKLIHVTEMAQQLGLESVDLKSWLNGEIRLPGDQSISTRYAGHSDHEGRYAYTQQPSIGMWNLERLLICFIHVVPKERLQEILNLYPSHFEKEYLRLARLKLGLKNPEEKDFELYIKLLQTLNQLSIDYTFFFRELCSYKNQKLKKVFDFYGQREELKSWLKLYDERIQNESISGQEMKLSNPKYILRSYIAQEVIEEVEKDEDTKLKSWLNILSHPYDEHPDFEAYAGPTPPEHKHYEVSCSS